MTRVLAVGYTSGEFLQDSSPVHLFPETLQREDLEHLVELVADDLGDQRAVLAVYPSWWQEPALRRLQTVRSALDASRMLLYPSPLPPLAGSVFCALAASVGPHVAQPGVLYAGLKLLERQVLTVARLRKVSGLREPAPSIWQHAAGWWPAAAFGVSWWPRPSVRRLRKKDPSVPLPPPAAWSGVPLERLAVASGGGSHTEWIERAVAAPLNVRTIVPTELPQLAARFWGTSNLLEAAAYPTDVSMLVSWLSEGSRASRCPWCGEQVVGSECPFCHMDRAAAFAVGEAV
jgi:hypothetical protein